MRYKNVMFDLDGTLMDTSKGVIKSIQYTIEHLNLPRLPDSILRKFIGPPIEKSFEEFARLSKADADKAAAIFRQVYPELFLFEAEFYDGIENLITHLKTNNIVVSVATNKRETYTNKLLKHFNIYDSFNYVVGSDDSGKMTKTDIINKCIELSGETKMTSVMIGDTKFDALSANELNTNFIAVTYGFGFKSANDVALYPHIAVCNNPSQINAVLSV